ncbi:hypothetical protein V1281_000404 [Nitrobacteraceae bacterium AZCC 2161]
MLNANSPMSELGSFALLLMKQPVLVDLRNVYRPEEMTQAGFTYESVGRGKRSNYDHFPTTCCPPKLERGQNETA